MDYYSFQQSRVHSCVVRRVGRMQHFEIASYVPLFLPEPRSPPIRYGKVAMKAFISRSTSASFDRNTK